MAGAISEPAISVLLFERLDESRWKAFAKPGKRLKTRRPHRFGARGGVCLLGSLDATVESKGEEGEIILAFDFTGAVLDEAIAAAGHMPLPPYISARRPGRRAGPRPIIRPFMRKNEGAVAAPTAGLHFTPELMARLDGPRHQARLRDAACRAGNLPAGQSRGYRRITACMRNASEITPEAAEQINAARRRRAAG